VSRAFTCAPLRSNNLTSGPWPCRAAQQSAGMPSLSAAARVCIIGVRRRAKRRFVRIKALRSLGSRNSSAITRRSSFGRLSIGMVGSIALVGVGWGHRKFIIIPPSLVVSSLLGALWLFFGGGIGTVLCGMVWYRVFRKRKRKEREKGKSKKSYPIPNQSLPDSVIDLKR